MLIRWRYDIMSPFYKFSCSVSFADLRLSDITDSGAHGHLHHHLKGATVGAGAPAAPRTTLKLSGSSHHFLTKHWCLIIYSEGCRGKIKLQLASPEVFFSNWPSVRLLWLKISGTIPFSLPKLVSHMNSGNQINHWSRSWTQFKDPVSHMWLVL